MDFTKANEVLKDLQAVCKKHGVQLHALGFTNNDPLIVIDDSGKEYPNLNRVVSYGYGGVHYTIKGVSDESTR